MVVRFQHKIELPKIQKEIKHAYRVLENLQNLVKHDNSEKTQLFMKQMREHITQLKSLL